LKSEPDSFSIDALKLAPKQTTAWGIGVRNFQARNHAAEDCYEKGRSSVFLSSPAADVSRG